MFVGFGLGGGGVPSVLYLCHTYVFDYFSCEVKTVNIASSWAWKKNDSALEIINLPYN